MCQGTSECACGSAILERVNAMRDVEWIQVHGASQVHPCRLSQFFVTAIGPCVCFVGQTFLRWGSFAAVARVCMVTM